MKKEVTIYLCDVCGKEVRDDDYLQEANIPVMYQDEHDCKAAYIMQRVEMCDECMKGLCNVIQEHFADISTDTCQPHITVNEIKYTEGKE